VTAIRSRRVWQVAGGPANRDYSGVFLDHGVALIGPGDSGRWKAGRKDDEFDGPYTRQLAEDVAAGDVFLLRTGRATIRAVGIVASEYKRSEERRVGKEC